jgi:hypothetical protein
VSTWDRSFPVRKRTCLLPKANFCSTPLIHVVGTELTKWRTQVVRQSLQSYGNACPNQRPVRKQSALQDQSRDLEDVEIYLCRDVEREKKRWEEVGTVHQTHWRKPCVQAWLYMARLACRCSSGCCVEEMLETFTRSVLAAEGDQRGTMISCAYSAGDDASGNLLRDSPAVQSWL